MFDRKRGKKGQAAMEFLMTYGWAILVVLAAIGALAYFGVLSPDRFLPEKCTLPSGMACLDFRYSGTGFEMVVQNSAGFDMNNVLLSIDGTGCQANATGPTSLTNGEKGTFIATCSPSSGKFRGDIVMSYTNQQTGMDHSKTGELIAKVD